MSTVIDYTLAIDDWGSFMQMNKASAINLTVPPNASVAFPVGARVRGMQYGAGTLALVAGGGVTIRSRGALTHTNGQYAVFELHKIGTDEWALSGDLA